MDDVEVNARFVHQKSGADRSYDEIIFLRNFIQGMDFVKATFREIHPRQADELCRNLGLEIFEPGQTIFEQGDLGDKFYVVLSGSCEIRTKNLIVDQGSGASQVREKLLFTCVPGQHFGERALEFNEPRAASVVAVAHTELLTVTKHVCII
jgi:CRP-like cAMP-binding protein